MNVLYVGFAQGFLNYDKFYLLPQKLINGFIRNGHNVYIFNDRDYARYSNIFRSRELGASKANQKLLEVCKEFQPKLIVLGHCEMIQNEILEEIRIISDGVKIVYRNVDPLFDQGNVTRIKHRSGVVDGIFITTAGEILKQFSHPDTFVSYIPNYVDKSIETAKSFENDKCNIDLFYGANISDSHKRTKDIHLIINSLSDINFKVVGLSHESPSVYGQAYMDLLAQSKMGLCLNKQNKHYLYSSDRMAQYMGSGLLTFIHKNHRFSDIFGSDALVEYNDTEELIDKIFYFVKNDRKRKNIARKGWELIHDYFDCQKIAKYIEEISFGLKPSCDYKWPTKIY